MASTITLADIPSSRGLITNPITTGEAQTIVPANSGMVNINSMNGSLTYTLPAVALCAGKMFWFLNAGVGGTYTTKITSAAADMFASDSTGTYVTCDATQSWCIIFSNGTNFFCLDGHGTWTLT